MTAGVGRRLTRRFGVLVALALVLAGARVALTASVDDAPQNPAPGSAAPAEPAPGDANPQDPAGGGGSRADEPEHAPSMVLKGFGDINLAYRDDGTPGGFSLGELDLFVTSELTPDVSVLAEIVFEPQKGTNPEIELERYMIRWAARDAFQVALGRMHSPLGYWNQAYHHGAWFQTTIERPTVYRFEHNGGVLPIHEVGLAVLGSLPVSEVALEYSVSVTNGRDPDPHEVQEFQDANSNKAVNLWLGVSPRALRSLKLGGVVRFDRIPPPTHRPEAGALDERIAGAFVAYTPRRVEALAEVLRVEHEARDTGERWRTLGLYVQGALRLGRFKPYYRYDYQDVDEGDPYYIESGTQSRHTLGVRYDPWSWAALKLEVYRDSPTAGAAFNAVAFQTAFTF
jgi:hypothetical protein